MSESVLFLLFPGTPQYQQGLKTCGHPRTARFTPDRTPPATTSCYWARRRAWRRGIAASSTTGSPSRSCWLTAQGRRMGRRSTTLCCLWPRCDLRTERRMKKRKEGRKTRFKLKEQNNERFRFMWAGRRMKPVDDIGNHFGEKRTFLCDVLKTVPWEDFDSEYKQNDKK